MKKILILLIGLVMINLASAWSNTTFNNSLGSETINIVAGENYIRYLQVPSSIDVITQAYINITYPYYEMVIDNTSEVDYGKTTPTGTSTQTTKYGMKIVMNQDKLIKNITKFASEVATTRCMILNSNKDILANSTFSGSTCSFATPYSLVSGTTYYFATDGAGASVEHYYDGGISYPVTDTELNWTDGLLNGNDGGDGTYASVISVGLADLIDSGNITMNIGNINIFTYNAVNYSTTNVTTRTSNVASSVNRYLNSTYLSGSNYLVPFVFSSPSNSFINYSEMLFSNEGFLENSQDYSTTVSSGDNTQFTINITSDLFTSAVLVYNNTRYTADSINNQGNDYIIIKNLTAPTVSSQANKTFYWEMLIDGSYHNSTSYNQTINEFGIDNCIANTILLINYTMYDEISKLLIPDVNNLTIKVDVDIYASDYETLVGKVSFNSSTNHTRVCLKSNLSSNSQYYLDAETQFQGGNAHAKKFYYIQKYLLTNNTIPINVNLYSINSSLITEFVLTFKNDNFIKEPGVIIDVTKKYIEEGIFRTIEIPKTDANGQAILHLQSTDSIYSMTFKKNGEILSVLNNIIAKCQSEILEECTLNVNAYSSNIEIQDFTYTEGLYLIESLDRDTNTITSTFTTQSGTKEVTLNVTKLDRFGNTSICSSSVTSSSGTLTCVVPDSYGNATVISEVYSDGTLASTTTYSLRDYTPNTYGSNVILALLIIITLSMMFINDLKGVLLGCFIGIVLSSALLYINSGNLFSVGTASTWSLVVVIMLIWKINHKEES